MRIKNPFSHSGRWDSVGLDCEQCQHFVGPASWPDKARESCCTRHDVPLCRELNRSGHREGEWFCRDFSDNGRARAEALGEFLSVRVQLRPEVLYGACIDSDDLIEAPFSAIQEQ